MSEVDAQLYVRPEISLSIFAKMCFFMNENSLISV